MFFLLFLVYIYEVKIFPSDLIDFKVHWIFLFFFCLSGFLTSFKKALANGSKNSNEKNRSSLTVITAPPQIIKFTPIISGRKYSYKRLSLKNS